MAELGGGRSERVAGAHVEVRADTSKLPGDVRKGAKEAAAGQKIEVPVEAARKRLEELNKFREKSAAYERKAAADQERAEAQRFRAQRSLFKLAGDRQAALVAEERAQRRLNEAQEQQARLNNRVLEAQRALDEQRRARLGADRADVNLLKAQEAQRNLSEKASLTQQLDAETKIAEATQKRADAQKRLQAAAVRAQDALERRRAGQREREQADLDVRGARAGLQQAVVRRELLDLDTKAAEDKVATLTERIKQIAQNRAQVNLDSAQAAAQAEALSAALDRAARDRRTRIDVDTDSATQSVGKVEGAASRAGSRLSAVFSGVTNIITERFRQAQTQAAATFGPATTGAQRFAASFSAVSGALGGVLADLFRFREAADEATRRRTAEVDVDTDRAAGKLSQVTGLLGKFGKAASTAFKALSGGQEAAGEISKQLDLIGSAIGGRGGQLLRVISVVFGRIAVGGPAAAIGIAAVAAVAATAASLLSVLTAGILGLVGALGQLAGLGGAAAAGLSTLAQVGGTVGLAFLGVGDAITQVNNRQEEVAVSAPKAAKSQVSAAKAIRGAQEGVEDAERALADARRDAARAEEDAARRIADARRQLADTVQAVGRQIEDADERVADARRRLVDSQRDAQRSQEELNQARAEARDRVRELAFELRRATLSEEEAILNLEEAQNRLNSLGQTGLTGVSPETLAVFRRLGVELAQTQQDVSDLERRRADLSVRQAQLTLEEARQRAIEAREEQAKSQRLGIEGDERVVEARERVVESQRAVADAARDVARAERDASDARVDGARQVADAQQALADAVRDAGRVREDSARRIADAQRQLERAQRAVGEAAESAAEGIGGDIPAAARRAEFALSQLSPAGREFVEFVTEELQPAIQRLQQRAETAFLPGLTAGLRELISLEPLVGTALDITGGALGELAIQGAAMLTSGPWREDFATLAQGNIGIISNAGQTIFNTADSLRILAVEGQPLLTRLSDLARESSGAALSFLAQKQATGELAEFFRLAGDRLEQLGRIGRDVFLGLVNQAQFFLPFGDLILGVVERAAAGFRSFSEQINQDEFLGLSVRANVGFLRDAFDGLLNALSANKREISLVLSLLLSVGTTIVGGTIRFLELLVNTLGFLTQMWTGMADAILGATQALLSFGDKVAVFGTFGGLDLGGLADSVGQARNLLSGAATDTAQAAEDSSTRQQAAAEAAKQAQRQYAEEVRQRSDQIRGSLESQIPAFRSIGEQAEVTSGEILQTLEANRDEMVRAAEGTAELLRRGVDPAIVEELANQGPGYITAFVDASDDELVRLEDAFTQRTDAATSAAENLALAGGGDTGTAFAVGLEGKAAEVDGAANTALTTQLDKRMFELSEGKAKKYGLDTGTNFAGSVTSTGGLASAAGGTLTDQFGQGLDPATGEAGTTGTNAGSAFAAQLRLQQASALDAGRILMQAQKSGLSPSIAESGGVGNQAGGRYAGGVREREGDARGAGSSLSAQLNEGIRSAFEGLAQTGRNAAQRVLQGFADQAGRVRGLGSGFINAVSGALGDGLGGMAPPGGVPFEGGRVGTGPWQAIEAFMRTTGVPFRVTSTVRPGARTATGRQSRHAVGAAIDFGASGPGGLMRIWEVLTALPLRELIYSPAPFQILGGRRYDGEPRNAAIRAQHFNHVHAAFDKGGLITEHVLGIGLRTGRSYSIAERGPEFVTSRRETARTLGGTLIGTLSVQVNAGGAQNPDQIAREVSRATVRELNRALVQAGRR